MSLVCVGDPDTSVFHEVLSQDSQSKVFQCRNESIGRHPVSRVVQRTLESTKLSCVIDQVGNLEFSRYVQGSLSWYEGE